MDKRKVPKPLKEFVLQVKKHFQPLRIILFGSRARGEATKWSDYDVLIVSDSFNGVDAHDRIVAVRRYHPGTVSLDIICLTPDEYEEERRLPTIISEIAKEGVELSS